MANYITAEEMTTITGVTAEQCGERGVGTTIRDAKITKAQADVLKDLNVTAFDGTETDYESVQEAIAYLAVHKISVRDRPLSSVTPIYSPYLEEYKQRISLLKTSVITKTTTMPTPGGFDVITMDDLD